MDLADSDANGLSYYQMDSQVTSDQLNSHPSHDLHNAAYPESDYQPPPADASSSRANTSQDSKNYLPEEPLLPFNSIRDAAHPDSDNRPVAGHSSSTDSSAWLASHQIQNPANPAGEPTAQTPGVIDIASASGPLDDVSSQFDGLVPPPPTYQPGEDDSSAYLLSGGNVQHVRYQTSNSLWPWTRRQPRQEAIPMTTFAVFRNAIGNITNRSNASSALGRENKEYNHIQANTEERKWCRNICKLLIRTLGAVLVIAVVAGGVFALSLKVNIFD
ncbi:hypothetical protein MY11210_002082 [Beauveria gryllotalpidicola]